MKGNCAYTTLGIIKYSDEFNQLLNIVYFFSHFIGFILLFYSTIKTENIFFVVFIVYFIQILISLFTLL